MKISRPYGSSDEYNRVVPEKYFNGNQDEEKISALGHNGRKKAVLLSIETLLTPEKTIEYFYIVCCVWKNELNKGDLYW